MPFTEKTISVHEIYTGRIIHVHRDTVALPDGNQSLREVVDHSGGVTVLPVDAEGNVTLVRQFRYPIGQEILEAPAGKLEEGEEPLHCGVRELSEETGYAAEEMISLGHILPSPGYCREVIYLYLALGLTPGQQHLDEGEFLDNVVLPLDQVCEMALNGQITDAKTIVAVLKTKEILKNRRNTHG